MGGRRKVLEDTVETCDNPYEDSSIRVYLQTAARTPLLSREKEITLFRRKAELQYQMLEQICLFDLGILARAYGGNALIETMEEDFPLPPNYSSAPFGAEDYSIFTERSEGASRAFRSDEYNLLKKVKESLAEADPEHRTKIIVGVVRELHEVIESQCLEGAGKEYLNLLMMRSELFPQESSQCRESMTSYLSLKSRRDRIYAEVMQANMLLVASIAKRYIPRGEYLDLIGEGNLGLAKAVDKFEYRYGHKFSTYATWWIRQSIHKGIVERGRHIRVPHHIQEILTKMAREGERFLSRNGRSPTLEEYDELLKLKKGTAEAALLGNPRFISLYTPLGEEETPLIEFLRNPREETPLDLLLDQEVKDRAHQLLRQMDGESSDSPNKSRLRNIIEMRHGIGRSEKMTLEEVGEEVHLTRERVRQLQVEGMKKLRELSKK